MTTHLDKNWSPVALLLATAVLSGCGGSGSASTPPQVVPTVVFTDPVDGAINVEPDTAIKIVLSPASLGLSPGDVIVDDGGNVLPGTLSQLGTSTTWFWTPALELPRGAAIHIATRSQGVLATFTVRDFVQQAMFELPGEAAGFALSWSNGRRAVITASGRVFEVTATGLIERFVEVTAGARAHGDGDFICERSEAGVHYCVRGNLDGSSDRVPTPSGVSIGENNKHGDVVAFVPSTVGTPAEWGLWRLMRADFSFSLAGSLMLASAVDEPSIQSDGSVSLAYRDAGRVRLSLFAMDNLIGEHHDLPVDGSGAHFDAGDDGRGVLAFVTIEPAAPFSVARVAVRVARYEPGSGLTVLSANARSWGIYLTAPEYHPFQRVDDVHVGDLGSACVVLASGSTVTGFPGVYTQHEVVRVEPDDQLTEAVLYMETSGVPPELSSAHFTELRAELWAMSSRYSPNTIWLVRSRPEAVQNSIAYKVAANGMAFGDSCFSFDDSGRAVLALTESLEAQVSTRVVLWN